MQKIIIDFILKSNSTQENIFYNKVLDLMNDKNIQKNNDCYFVSHLGLGDNITMSSVPRYLTIFYNKVYVFVKDNKNYDNMKLIFEDNQNIILVKINPNREFANIKEIVNSLPNNIDLFVSGFCHTSYLKNKITNQYLINNKIHNEYGSFKYKHIVNFFNDIFMDFRIYSTFFYIPENKTTIELFEQIKNKKIIFTHTKSSNKEIFINFDKYVDSDDFFIVCPNKNFYKITHKNYDLANKYVNLYLSNYISIIKNAVIIKIIDSSFSCIVIPLQIKKELKTDDIEICDR